jgi:anti-sigma B factor antagonist
MGDLHIQVQHRGYIIILCLSGGIEDWELPGLECVLEKLLRGKHRYVVLDCSELLSVNAAGLLRMRDYVQSFHAAGGNLKLAELPEPIAPLAHVLGLHQKTDLQPDVATAVASLVSQSRSPRKTGFTKESLCIPSPQS